MDVLTMIVLATLAGGVLSVLLAALLALTVLARWANRLVSFAVGVLLAAALLKLWPESANALGPEEAGAWVLGGVLLFFVLEKLALWRHDHHGHRQASGPERQAPTGPMILLGDGMHNFIDGVLIAAAFLQDPAVGVAVAAAVVLHEVPQEIGDFMILLNAGYSKRRALAYNALSGAAAVLGGVLGFFALRGAESVVPHLLALAAASFLYIAVADLVPELHRARRLTEAGLQFGLILVGIASITLLHTHPH
jgi:zinc and cadmium transporter